MPRSDLDGERGQNGGRHGSSRKGFLIAAGAGVIPVADATSGAADGCPSGCWIEGSSSVTPRENDV